MDDWGYELMNGAEDKVLELGLLEPTTTNEYEQTLANPRRIRL